MISVSYLKSIYNKKDTIKKIDESIADMIHVDLMDGSYVENKNFTIDEVIDDLKDTKKPLDIHLMVNNPEIYIDELAKLKPFAITFHLDSTNNKDDVINQIKDYNIKVGIAINPDEDISILDGYLELIDYVLVMSVVPGKGGQTFIKDVLDKIKQLENKNILIGIDGGINSESITYLKNYKIDNIISGSFVCMSDDYNMKIEELKERA
ncbi:MAG: ribulose-phosphate 3-epimerase [Bacilli bacterium]|nr:ribulose-phosphate 3-epimerase [Bacilli bacterium]